MEESGSVIYWRNFANMDKLLRASQFSLTMFIQNVLSTVNFFVRSVGCFSFWYFQQLEIFKFGLPKSGTRFQISVSSSSFPSLVSSVPHLSFPNVPKSRHLSWAREGINWQLIQKANVTHRIQLSQFPLLVIKISF